MCQTDIVEIKILGSGCTKCKSLYASVVRVVGELNIPATVTKEEDIMKILTYNVISTPALVIDEIVVSSGKLLSDDEIKRLLIQH